MCGYSSGCGYPSTGWSMSSKLHKWHNVLSFHHICKAVTTKFIAIYHLDGASTQPIFLASIGVTHKKCGTTSSCSSFTKVTWLISMMPISYVHCIVCFMLYVNHLQDGKLMGSDRIYMGMTLPVIHYSSVMSAFILKWPFCESQQLCRIQSWLILSLTRVRRN